MYIDVGDVETTELMFRSALVLDTVSCNIMISGYNEIIGRSVLAHGPYGKLEDIEFMKKKLEGLDKPMKRSNDKLLKIEHELCERIDLAQCRGDWRLNLEVLLKDVTLSQR
ncbi:hypothetical protein ACJX0J_006295, partial [Zea mays]